MPFVRIYVCLTFVSLIHAFVQAVSVSIIAWRVYTFNDCKEAAEELQQEIKEAREDLKQRGLKLD